MGYGSFFKGEQKKKRKGQDKSSGGGFAPVFVPPKVVGKDKKEG